MTYCCLLLESLFKPFFLADVSMSTAIQEIYGDNSSSWKKNKESPIPLLQLGLEATTQYNTSSATANLGPSPETESVSSNSLRDPLVDTTSNDSETISNTPV